MAGRGTDIQLGAGVADVGGLHVIGTERHEARRIDRQLRGRCARQGDPGSSHFFISLEDDLMRLFGSDRIVKALSGVGLEEGQEVTHPLLTRSADSGKEEPVSGSMFDGLSPAQFAVCRFISDSVRKAYELKISCENAEQLKTVERYTILSAIDRLWQEHLYGMDSLRNSIGLRAY